MPNGRCRAAAMRSGNSGREHELRYGTRVAIRSTNEASCSVTTEPEKENLKMNPLYRSHDPRIRRLMVIANFSIVVGLLPWVFREYMPFNHNWLHAFLGVFMRF